MPKILKLLIAFGAIALLLLAWFGIFGFQTWVRSEANKDAQKRPGMRLTPVPLTNTLVNPPGNSESCYGYFVRMPWQGKAQPKNDLSGKAGCSFSDGKNIVAMYVGDADEDLNNFYVVPSMRNLLQQKYFGNDPPKTDFDLIQRVLAFTPDALPRHGGWGEIERDTKLLGEKKSIVNDTGVDDVIYSISTPALQGFQFSAPGAKASVEVRLYNDENKVTLTFLTTGKGAPLPQPSINTVVQSVRRDPSVPVQSNDSE
jgi:hypothetical protein